MSRQSQGASSVLRAVCPDAASGFSARLWASDSSVVRVEERWRCPPFSEVDAAAADRILAGSWSEDVAAGEPREMSSVGDGRFYTVGIALSATTLKFQHDGKIICDGPVMPGSIQITKPGESVRAFYASPRRVMHLFISPDLLSRRFDEAAVQHVRPDLADQDPRILREVAVERLALALQDANALADTFGRMYADGICDAIGARLLARRADVISA